MECIEVCHRDWLPSQIHQAWGPAVQAIWVEQYIGKRVVASMGRTDVPHASTSEM